MDLNRLLRQPSRGFWRDTWHSVRVGVLVLSVCTFGVAVLYASPVMHSMGWEATQ